MVDKQNKTKRQTGIVDQHDDGAGARYAKLEARLEVVLARLDEMTQEVLAIKQQQADLLTIVRTNLKKK
jgi:hypothetical protein